MNNQTDITHDDIQKDTEETKEIGQKIKNTMSDFDQKIKEINDTVSEKSKDISEDIESLDETEKDAGKDFEKLMIEEAENIATEEKEAEI